MEGKQKPVWDLDPLRELLHLDVEVADLVSVRHLVAGYRPVGSVDHLPCISEGKLDQCSSRHHQYNREIGENGMYVLYIITNICEYIICISYV